VLLVFSNTIQIQALGSKVVVVVVLVVDVVVVDVVLVDVLVVDVEVVDVVDVEVVLVVHSPNPIVIPGSTVTLPA